MTAEEPKSDQTRYFPVPLDAVEHGVQQVDLHIRFDTMPGQPTLYRATGLEFSKSDSERLAEQAIGLAEQSAVGGLRPRAVGQRFERADDDPR